MSSKKKQQKLHRREVRKERDKKKYYGKNYQPKQTTNGEERTQN